jgi:hypothetical protein
MDESQNSSPESWSERLIAGLGQFSQIMAPELKKLKAADAALRAIMRPVAELMLKAAKAQPNVMPYLADRGWFVTMDLPSGWFVAIEALRAASKHDEADDAMCQFARKKVDDTEAQSIDRFPARAAILKEAFTAHRDRKYALSIAVLLAQADGMGREILHTRQFFNKKRPEALKDRLAGFQLFGRPYTPWGVLGDMLRQISGKTSIEEDTDLRDERRLTDDWFGPLNRHGVLHGLDLDYPNEVNSLRCVLLVRYLLDVDRILREEIPERLAELNKMLDESVDDRM